jgi:8-oxo-dGTP pyrophosphatase MutT (NUDIX family)
MTLENRITHFTGRVVSLTVDDVTLPNGHRTPLEIVHHPGGAAAVAIDEDERVCLLRQYRHAAEKWLWELPAGKLEPNEPALLTAQRELAEEAGVSARKWDSLGIVLPSPGVLTEKIHLFMATGIAPAKAAPEQGEVFELSWVPLAQAYRWALDGTIDDGKSIIGLFRAFERRRR